MEKRTWNRVECNTSPTSQEEESSNSEAKENIITDIGYNVVENNEKLGQLLSFWKYNKTKTNAYTLLCHKNHATLSFLQCIRVCNVNTKAWATLRPKTMNEVMTMLKHWPLCGQ